MSFSRSAWLKGLEEDDESDDEILDEEVCIPPCTFCVKLLRNNSLYVSADGSCNRYPVL